MSDPDDVEVDPRTVAVLVSDPNGVVVQQNTAATSLLGPAVSSCSQALSGAAGAAHLPCHEECVRRLLEAGADRTVLRTVELDGRRYTLCCVPATGCVVTTLTSGHEVAEPWERPTPREMQVLRLLAEGQTNPDIAEALGVAEKTVRAHVEHLRGKLSVPTRAALVARAFKMKLLP